MAVNAAATRLLGYSQEELRQLTFNDLREPGESSGLWRSRFARALRKDGRAICLELKTVTQARAPQYAISHLRLAGKPTEDTLERERAFLKQVIDTAPNLIYVKDAQGRYVMANKATSDLLGVPMDHLIGKTAHDLRAVLTAEEWEELRRQDREILNTGSAFSSEVRFIDSEGRSRWFNGVKVPLFSEDGTGDKILVVATEFTERKLAEEALQQSEERFRNMFYGSTFYFTLPA